MRRKILCVMAVLILTMSMSITAMAAEWKQDDIGWMYLEDDGSYPFNTWKEINGKWYYFNANGYMLAGIVTPDGYTLDGTGAWNQNIPKQEKQQTQEWTVDENGFYVGPEGEKPGYIYVPGFGYLEIVGDGTGPIKEDTAVPDEPSGEQIGYMG